MKAFFGVISMILASSVYGMPADPYHAPGNYKHEAPKPFAYNYGVKDEYAGTDFDKKETQDEYGVVNGEYSVVLPDGRIQHVTYHADHENGFVADVKYEGTPQYPPAPKGGYGPKPIHPIHA